MRRLSLLLVLPLLLVSCDKKDLEEVDLPQAETWEVHPAFTHNFRYINNFHATDKHLFVMGLKHFSTITFAANQDKVEHASQYFTNTGNYKFPINAKIFVEAAEQRLHFKLSENPLITMSDLIVEMKEADPHFRNFHLVESDENEAIALTDNNVALVPYYAYDAQSDQHLGARLLLVKLSFEKGDLMTERITLAETKVVNVKNNGGPFPIVKSFDGYFYLHNVEGLLRISEEGEVENVMSNPFIYKIFKHNSNLYTLAWNDHRVGLYKSANGRNWTHLADLSTAARDLSYYSVSNDLLLAVYKSQLFELNLESFFLKELDNSGLDGHAITSLMKAKHKIYVASQSGLFQKHAEHLLTYKETDK